MAENREELILGSGGGFCLVAGELSRFVKPGVFLRHPGSLCDCYEQFDFVLGPDPRLTAGSHGHGPNQTAFFNVGYSDKAADLPRPKKLIQQVTRLRISRRIVDG